MMTSHYGILEPRGVGCDQTNRDDEVVLTRVVKVLINLLKFIVLHLVKKKRFVRLGTVVCRRYQPHIRLWKSLKKTLRSEG